MTTQRRTRIFLVLAAVAAVGLAWWLLAWRGQGAAPVAVISPATQQAVAVQPAITAEPLLVDAAAAVAAPSTPIAASMTEQRAVAPALGVTTSAHEVAVAPATAPRFTTDEVVATERMYLAHAPLRVPEVADPDSESNRRILQTMVGKALRAPAATPTASTTH